jgi:hypothetical protein
MLRLLPAVLCLAAIASAQTPPCLSLNDLNTTVSGGITSYGFAGPNTFGYQITPATSMVAFGAQFFTGNTTITPGFMTVEIWDENPATGLPGSRMGGGTWQIAPGLGTNWQGANLDQVVPLNQGSNYWLVWIEPGFSVPATEPNGATPVPYALRNGTSWTLQASQQAVKARLFCSYLDGANVTTYGNACGSASGQIGTAFTNEEPLNGNSAFKIEGSGFASGSLAVLVVGWDPFWVSQPVPGFPLGCEQHTDALAATFGVVGTGNVRSNITTGALGHVTFNFSLPPVPAFIGVFLSTQIAGQDVLNPAPIPFVLSNAVRFVVQ